MILILEKTTFIDSVPSEFFLFFPSDWHIAKIATDKEDQDIRVIVIKLDYNNDIRAYLYIWYIRNH